MSTTARSAADSGVAPAPAGIVGTARLLPTIPARHWSDHLQRLGPSPVRRGPQLAEMVRTAGLRGRGGGGFPTADKITAVAGISSSRRPAVVIANCCESDPTSAKDAVLLANSPHLVIDGALSAAAAVGADRVFIAVHRESPVRAVIQRAVAERLSFAAVSVTVAGIPDRFVASEATALVRYLNIGDARPGGRLRKIWESGVNGRPTLVDNAETLAQLALIDRFGPAWFGSVGTRSEPGTDLITVGGAVGRPGVVEVAGGTRLQTILAATGWVRAAPGPAWALIGGLAGRWVDLATAGETGFSAGELASVGGTKGVSSIVVLPPGGCVLAETARILDFLAAAGARQCGPCMFGLPAIAADMARLAGGDREALGRLYRRLPVIDGRGGCGHPDGAVALAASALRAVTGPAAAHLDQHLTSGGCEAGFTVVPLPGNHLSGTGWHPAEPAGAGR